MRYTYDYDPKENNNNHMVTFQLNKTAFHFSPSACPILPVAINLTIITNAHTYWRNNQFHSVL